jgi:hypothetical protein
MRAALLVFVGLLAAAPVARAQTGDLVSVRLMPSVMAFFQDPDMLLRDEPLRMVILEPSIGNTLAGPIANDCASLETAQAQGYFPATPQGQALEPLASDLCRITGRYRATVFETIEAPTLTLHADVLDLWSAWFQLAVSANVADAVEDAVRRGISLGGFEEPSLLPCGPRAVDRKDPWTVTAVNSCDSIYLSVVGEEVMASGEMRPIVFYHLSATGGTLRVAGYAVVAPHPASGVWTPVQMLGR